MKRYRKAFLVTVSTAGSLSCGAPEPVESVPTISHNPPEVLEMPSATTTATGPAPTAETTTAPTAALPLSTAPINHADFVRDLHPRDADKRKIKLAGEGQCFVELPFAKPPTSVQPPPTKTVPCPPAMRDPAWLACTGGDIRANAAGSECICDFFGNPPPPSKRVACPRTP